MTIHFSSSFSEYLNFFLVAFTLRSDLERNFMAELAFFTPFSSIPMIAGLAFGEIEPNLLSIFEYFKLDAICNETLDKNLIKKYTKKRNSTRLNVVKQSNGFRKTTHIAEKYPRSVY